MAGDTGPSMMTRAFTGHCNWRSQRSTVLSYNFNETRNPPEVSVCKNPRILCHSRWAKISWGIYIYIYKTFIIYVRPELGQPLECRSIKSIPERLGQPKTYQQVDSSQHQFVTKKAVLLTTVPRTTSLQKQGKMGVNNTLLGGMVNSARFAHLRKREGFRRKVPLTKQKESRYVFSSLASLYTTWTCNDLFVLTSWISSTLRSHKSPETTGKFDVTKDSLTLTPWGR